MYFFVLPGQDLGTQENVPWELESTIFESSEVLLGARTTLDSV